MDSKDTIPTKDELEQFYFKGYIEEEEKDEDTCPRCRDNNKQQGEPI